MKTYFFEILKAIFGQHPSEKKRLQEKSIVIRQRNYENEKTWILV